MTDGQTAAATSQSHNHLLFSAHFHYVAVTCTKDMYGVDMRRTIVAFR